MLYWYITKESIRLVQKANLLEVYIMIWYVLGGIVLIGAICAAVTFLKEKAPTFVKFVLACCAIEGALLAIYFIMKWTWIFAVMKLTGVLTVLLLLCAVLVSIFKRF